jgi:hypothetical protein
VSTDRLLELSEADATGRTAELYADIRAVLGLPMVNLVYRHLATKPGVLEQCWAELRPNFASRAVAAAADELVALALPPGVVSLPPAALAVAGLAGAQLRLARSTLAAYRRANSLNALGLAALLDGGPGGVTGGEEVAPPLSEPILPMASIEELSLPAAALLDEMSLHVVGGDEPRLIPSLLRHFAADPCALALVWTALRPSADEIACRGADLARRARSLVSALPHRVTALHDDGDRAAARRFMDATARMLVVGEALSAAVVEAA